MTESDAQGKTDADRRQPDSTDDPLEADYTVAVSPRQLAGGFAILAAILVLIVRSRSRSRRRRGAKNDAD